MKGLLVWRILSKQNKVFVYLGGRNSLICMPKYLWLSCRGSTNSSRFLMYHETIQGHSRKTVDEYYLDLRNFFRYIKIERGFVPRSAELDEISVEDVDLSLVASVTLTDVYSYMAYLSRDGPSIPTVLRPAMVWGAGGPRTKGCSDPLVL